MFLRYVLNTFEFALRPTFLAHLAMPKWAYTIVIRLCCSCHCRCHRHRRRCRRLWTLILKSVSAPCIHYYHPRMRVGNVFSHVCLSVCLSVCLGYNFWTALHRNFIFWHGGMSWPYLDQVWVSRSLGQGHVQKMLVYLFNLLFLCMWLQVINKVKVTHQDQGQVKVKSWTFLRRDAFYMGWFAFEFKCILVYQSFVEHKLVCSSVLV